MSEIRHSLRIGLTGPIGCGKSTVASWLAAEGLTVIDADQVARDVVEPGSPTLAAILREFGPAIATSDGRLDRQALARIVFRDAAALGRLEALTHPAVRPRILEAIARADMMGAPGVVIEAIKLVEGGLSMLCDEVWLAVCDAGEQRSRLRGRGVEVADAEARIAAQADLESRLRGAATRIIDTSGPRAGARARALEALAAARSARPAAN